MEHFKISKDCDTNVFCNICKCSIINKSQNKKKHLSTIKHKNNLNILKLDKEIDKNKYENLIVKYNNLECRYNELKNDNLQDDLINLFNELDIK